MRFEWTHFTNIWYMHTVVSGDLHYAGSVRMHDGWYYARLEIHANRPNTPNRVLHHDSIEHLDQALHWCENRVREEIGDADYKILS